MDRLTRETGFDGRTQRYGYNLLGQLTDKTEESLPTRPMIRYDYDEVGNLTARHLPASRHIQPITERFEWDESGQMVCAYGRGNKTEFSYDKRGRLLSETQTQVQQKGQIWQWKHRQEVNELGVKRRSCYGEIPPLDWLTYGSGHLHGIHLGDFNIDFERDGLHREISRNIRTVHSRLLFFNDTGYNALGDIAERILEIGGTAIERKRYQYDPLGRLTEINDTLGSRIRYRYDKAGRLTGSSHGPQSWQYAFDSAGNRIDPRPLLPGQAPENWAETVRRQLNDPDFNPLAYTGYPETHASRQWIDNRITELDGIRNTYDGAGNLIEQTRPDGTKLDLYYDGAFRLTALKKTNPGGTTTTAWYGYDAFSRRIAKGVSEGNTEKITRYGWEGDKLTHEATEETLTTIIYGPDGFVPQMRIEQAVKKEGEKSEREQAKQEAMKLVEGLLAAEGMELKKPTANPDTLSVSFFVTDHAGTPGKLIDERGEILWEAEADDWGAVRNEKGVRQPIRFQGQWLDEESGFYYNRYRYYDPRQGRYVTQDPIGLEGGVDVYTYVNGNPLSYTDPLGLTPDLNCVAKCAAAGGMAGSIIGGALGGAGGGLLCSPTGPGAFGCAGAGGLAGAGKGAAIGAGVGGILGNIICSDDTSHEECDPPKGTICFITDRVPPSKPHYPIEGSHYHLWQMNQNPSSGKCFWNKLNASRTAPPGAIPCPFKRPPR
jgi:RHS repeat-associated protein